MSSKAVIYQNRREQKTWEQAYIFRQKSIRRVCATSVIELHVQYMFWEQHILLLKTYIFCLFGWCYENHSKYHTEKKREEEREKEKTSKRHLKINSEYIYFLCELGLWSELTRCLLLGQYCYLFKHVFESQTPHFDKIKRKYFYYYISSFTRKKNFIRVSVVVSACA